MEKEEEAQELVHEKGNNPLEAKLELTVDEVVEKYVGSFGFSQLLHVLLVSLAWIFDSQNTLITIFTDAQPAAWRCKTLDPKSNYYTSNNASISSSLCMSKTSTGNKGQFDRVCGMAAGTWEWIGGNTTSTIAEWGLICDRKFLAAVPASLFFIGSIFGKCSLIVSSLHFIVLVFPFFPKASLIFILHSKMNLFLPVYMGLIADGESCLLLIDFLFKLNLYN